MTGEATEPSKSTADTSAVTLETLKELITKKTETLLQQLSDVSTAVQDLKRDVEEIKHDNAKRARQDELTAITLSAMQNREAQRAGVAAFPVRPGNYRVADVEPAFTGHSSDSSITKLATPRFTG